MSATNKYTAAFANSVYDRLRVNISEKQLEALYAKYRIQDSDTFDFVKFYKDSKAKAIDAAKMSQPPSSPNIGPTATWQSITHIPTGLLMGNKTGHVLNDATLRTHSFEEIVVLLSRSIAKLFPGVYSSKELLRRCFLQIGIERGRRLVFSNHDVRHILNCKFNLQLSPKSIDNIFDRLDPFKTGEIKMRTLLNEAIYALLSSNGFFGDSYQHAVDVIQPRPGSISSKTTTTVVTTASQGSLESAQPESNSNASSASPLPEVDSSSSSSGGDIFAASPNSNSNSNSEIDRMTMSTKELEDLIYHKVKEKVVGRDFHQTLLLCFRDSRRKDKHNCGITQDQMWYTLKYKFGVNVTQADISALFNKHAVTAQSIAQDSTNADCVDVDVGCISLNKFVTYLIKGHDCDTPLIEEDTYRTHQLLKAVSNDANSQLPTILDEIRDRLLAMINRHSKSPNYLLQTHQNLTRKQTIDFFASKLKLSLTEEMVDEICTHYSAPHNKYLIDVRRLMHHALSRSLDKKKVHKWKLKHVQTTPPANHPSYVSEDFYVFGNHVQSPVPPPQGQNNNNDSIEPVEINNQPTTAQEAFANVPAQHQGHVQISEMPHSLRNIRKSKQEIRRMLFEKLIAKHRHASPLSLWHTLFDSHTAASSGKTGADDNNQNTGSNKYATKSKLRQVLLLHDIIVTDEEFNDFFEDIALTSPAASDQTTATVANSEPIFDIRQFLVSLFPPDYPNDVFSAMAETQQQRKKSMVATSSPNDMALNRQQQIMSATNTIIQQDQQNVATLTHNMMIAAELNNYHIHAQASGNYSNHGFSQTQTSGVQMAWMFAGQPNEGPDVWASSQESARRNRAAAAAAGVGAGGMTSRPKSAGACVAGSRPRSSNSRPNTAAGIISDNNVNGNDKNNGDNNNNMLCIVGSRPTSAAPAGPAAPAASVSPIPSPARPTTAPPSSARSPLQKGSPLTATRLREPGAGAVSFV